MMTKEQFYEYVKEIRSVLDDPDNLKCSCPKIECEWHDDYKNCVAVHRYYKEHIPNCLQAVFNDKVKEIVQIFELNATEKMKTPAEYWNYVRERDLQQKQSLKMHKPRRKTSRRK
jgi:hypothetical protein